MSNDFYRNARGYDIAFADRDFDVECDFLEWCVKNHAKIDKDKTDDWSFLELGAGPSRHAREMAYREWRSVALDISEEMMEYAKQEAGKDEVEIETVVSDMIDYELDKPVLLTATLMESISHIVTNEDMIKHFRSVARNTVPGGLYVIEATHPMFFFPDNEPNTWTSEEDGTKVEITFGMPSDKYNTVTQQWTVTTRMKINENGTEHFTENKSQIRWYLAQEMKALVELSGVFDYYWIYGSLYYTPPQQLDESENSDAMVFVMRVK